MKPYCWTTCDSPIGLIYLATYDDKLCALTTGPRAKEQLQEHLDRIGPETQSVESPGGLEIIKRQLFEYFDGKRQAFDLPLYLKGTPFQESVWNELLTIPFGQTISYGELANRLNNLDGVRAVGTANGRNPISIVVPCHRVIQANGSLGGYAGGLEIKHFLLEHEAKQTKPTLF